MMLTFGRFLFSLLCLRLRLRLVVGTQLRSMACWSWTTRLWSTTFTRPSVSDRCTSSSTLPWRWDRITWLLVCVVRVLSSMILGCLDYIRMYKPLRYVYFSTAVCVLQNMSHDTIPANSAWWNSRLIASCFCCWYIRCRTWPSWT